MNWNFNNGNLNENSNSKLNGFSVRLFHEGISRPPAGFFLVNSED